MAGSSGAFPFVSNTQEMDCHPSGSFPSIELRGAITSGKADHFGAAFAVVNVGPDLHHAEQQRVVCRGNLLSARAPKAADGGDLDRGPF